ncbi:MAG: hypothetical protein L3J32_13125, partial [Rhizobiaceae bacterium]|nr:hypothetical protein [Rhizobiaceae bacterium]
MSVDNIDPKQAFSVRRLQEVEDIANDQNGNDDEISEIAEQVAAQFASDSIAPYLITGLVRLAEFFGLLAIAYIIHRMYVSDGSLPSFFYIYGGVLGAFFTISFIQALDGYDIIT